MRRAKSSNPIRASEPSSILHPRMSFMEIKSMGDFNPFDIHEVNRPDHRMDSVLVIKILIKFAISTFVIPVASFKIDASFHMVQAWTFPSEVVFLTYLSKKPFALFFRLESCPLFPSLLFSSQTRLKALSKRQTGQS